MVQEAETGSLVAKNSRKILSQQPGAPMNHMLRQAGMLASDGILLITAMVLSSCSWPGRSTDFVSPLKILQVDTAII